METLEFQAEARQLLQLVIHSLYSNKDIFLRELISNAADALDKLRLAAYQDKDLEADLSDPRIELAVDKDARTLTVRDNGIGMTRDEVVGLIGTIARSGTAELLAKLRETKDAAASKELIGQFGVGFYSSFMVADTVTLVTRRAGTAEGTRWESDGEGTYTIDDAPDAPVGTAVTLHLKPADADDKLFDYADEWKIREIVKRYSDFIPWRITLAGGDGEPLNSMKALWARSKNDIKPEEYAEFYKHLSHDWTDPLEVVHMRGEGTFEYDALLFIPERAPFDLFRADGKRGVQLYVKRVFIMDDCEALTPDYLRFLRGVVDAADLSLNVSREILQQDRQIQAIRKRLVRQVLQTIGALEPDKYRTFWDQFGRVIKEGLLSDADNREAILGIASFATTHDPSALTKLSDYVSRMKDGQTDIYVMTGESRTTIENSPHLEAFKAKGYEVLLLTDPVDEVWLDIVGTFDGHKLQSIAKGAVDLSSAEDAPEREEQAKDFAPLLAWVQSSLDEEVKEVRLSTRLTTSPACLVTDANDITPALAKMYAAMGQELPPTKRILELNADHPLVAGLREAHGARPDDASLGETVELLYGTAVLAEGGDLRDPARFARLLADRLERTL
ncbi:molecular chaperone HtpG [Luedemannella helvata]|uniref:Chaperone protein HtpG n=1 Tax=Luedemannella helvata TaxID=349315 RepID=A0ABP4WDR7_9ACTN